MFKPSKLLAPGLAKSTFLTSQQQGSALCTATLGWKGLSCFETPPAALVSSALMGPWPGQWNCPCMRWGITSTDQKQLTLCGSTHFPQPLTWC